MAKFRAPFSFGSQKAPRLAALILLSARLVAAQIGVWETRAPFPIEATEVSSAAVGDKVYVVGGFLPNGSSNRLFIYDAFTDTWSEGAPLPVAGGVDHANVAALNGKFYFLGGIRIGTDFVTGQTFVYDPPVNRWTELASMPTPRGASGVATLGGRIYVAGGLTATDSIDNFEAFDPASNTWSILPPMPTARDHLTAQALNGKFYAIAGRRGPDFRANEEYDPATNRWTARAPIPTARGGLGSGTIGGRIQVFGGEGASGTPDGTFAQNEEYDPATDTWRSLAPMPTPRHGLYGATIDGKRIFAPSGGPQAGATFTTVHEAFYLPPPVSPVTAGVVNAASFEPAVARGSIATLFGTNLSSGSQIAIRLPLPTQMNATSVLVNGVVAPLFFVGPSQINFLVPSQTRDPATIVVRQAGIESPPQSLPLFSSALGIFSVSQDGKGQGAILHANGGGLASPANPATVGEVIEIYFTGLFLATGGVQVPQVTVGGIATDSLFVGGAPGFVGLFQENVRVPSGVTPGPAVPVRFVNSVSNEVTIGVR